MTPVWDAVDVDELAREEDEIPCGNCGRLHVPDADDPTQADTCWECQNGYGDDA